MPRTIFALLAAMPALALGGPVSGDHSLVPGLMGYNALPALVATDPAIDDELAFELSGVVQVSDFTTATDAAAYPYLRLFVPFRHVAALELDAIPVESWRVGPETQQRLDAAHASGTTKGDIRLSAEFALVHESPGFPALGVRVFLKSASGKGIEDRRFLSAPGYAADLLAAKTLPWRLGDLAVRVVANAGMFVWEQGSSHQDDAFAASARVLLRAPGKSRLALDWRGYWGWQQYDKPMVLGATAGWRAAQALEILGIVDRGLTSDAPPWTMRLGLVLYLDARSMPGVGSTIAD